MGRGRAQRCPAEPEGVTPGAAGLTRLPQNTQGPESREPLGQKVLLSLG